jgi:poly [ADP-ribose] polymerase
MASTKVWKLNEQGAPAFPADYQIVRRAVLQVTDLGSNRNKYYALELHAAQQGGASRFRVFTHYGRTDDLETRPDAGQKECRYFASAPAAEAEYLALYRDKTSARKGYREVALAASRIGSTLARGTSSGQLDARTVAKIAASAANDGAAPPPPALEPVLARLVDYLYAEATNALTSTIAAKITAQGIETPLGVLTIGQIERGEAILQSLYALFQQGAKSRERMQSLSGEFYTVIPHRIGRSRSAIEASVIDSMEAFEQKQETLQLMKDMLRVNGEHGSVLYGSDLAARYAALGCELRPLARGSEEYSAIERQLLESPGRSRKIRVCNVFALRRAAEWEGFRSALENQRLLLHGSRIRNWVGILSRGLLLPKIAVSMGVRRTDAGWLGNGIYFGDATSTSLQYTSSGREGTGFLALARVALGRVKDYTRITYGLTAPPAAYHSCHGVRARAGVVSQFADDEYVIYDPRQQRLEYLVEFAA